MHRATPSVHEDDETVVDVPPAREVVHDFRLEETLRRLTAPPAPAPAPRPTEDRAVYGLD
jgi:hypothetical protein